MRMVPSSLSGGTRRYSPFRASPISQHPDGDLRYRASLLANELKTLNRIQCHSAVRKGNQMGVVNQPDSASTS